MWTLGITENVEIIRRIGGRAKDLKVTFATRTTARSTWKARPACGCGSASSPHALVADIREIERVCREEEPDQALAFIEYIQPVADADTKDELDAELERLLGRDAGRRRASVPVVPTSVLEHFGAGAQLHDEDRPRHGRRGAHAGTRGLPPPHPAQRDGERVEGAARRARALNADDDGRRGPRPRAGRQVAGGQHVPRIARRFFLMDGDWFEIGAEYVRASRDAIGRLFPATPTVDLPPWYLPKGATEYDYNCYVAVRSGGDTCAWTGTRRSATRSGRAAAWRSATCSARATSSSTSSAPRDPRRSATCSPRASSRRRAWSPGRPRCGSSSSARSPRCPRRAYLPADFKPTKVVYAILLENGKQLTPDTLFPFSQATLAHAARILGTYGIDVEVVGIPAA